MRVEERSSANALLAALLAGAALSGCATGVPAPSGVSAEAALASVALPRYRCEGDIEFTVRFTDDAVAIDSGQLGHEILLRDAGGTTPQQTVYSNVRMGAEFGLGTSGREALLRFAQGAPAARCTRD
jgi:hypothetical protein